MSSLGGGTLLVIGTSATVLSAYDSLAIESAPLAGTSCLDLTIEPLSLSIVPLEVLLEIVVEPVTLLIAVPPAESPMPVFATSAVFLANSKWECRANVARDTILSAMWSSSPSVTLSNQRIAGDGSYAQCHAGPLSAGTYVVTVTLTLASGNIVPGTFTLVVV
jgi:hypothetical protein